jgi:DNA-3-methyladenine glycosylase I
MTDLIIGPDDDHARCGWGVSTPDYVTYHDQEWGRPVVDERVLFEKLCLEGFQSGLSWLTILRKREAFREVFDNFNAESVAQFDESDVLRLLDDSRIVRHRGKIEAAINNACVLLEVRSEGSSLCELLWSHRPETPVTPGSMADIAATTPESIALAKQLKARGFRFVGPTTAYAAMQAMGVVNDHLEGCWVRDECQNAQTATISDLGIHTYLKLG